MDNEEQIQLGNNYEDIYRLDLRRDMREMQLKKEVLESFLAKYGKT